MYTVERVPLPKCGPGRRTNPITRQMRMLDIGESFIVPFDDPSWKEKMIYNENARAKPRNYVTIRESNGYRIGRVS